ncbi:thiamine/thiamine pyrophosphate ABC transporter permease [Mesorhizobium koreense]|uniref:thiamine/thiamine pyrophosphate ABC transporter permease n=1 Tax=Mesorhizobium koreense TaxID=3074855 RepID=UPI00287B79E2|nr:thiamine/thiamine pyrophosphate ABC transporter permease [Mesorhizobium sp. WR6]
MALGDEQIGVAPLDGRVAAGAVALAAVALVAGGALAGLVFQAGSDWSGAFAAFDLYLLRVARFTLFQAVLSTVLSVAPAVVVARAFSRHPKFPGRALMLRLFAVPLALPAIVAALGVLALYGRAGIFSGALAKLAGGDWSGVYGLSGILIAHVFFNLPLATRLFLQALDTVPDDQWRLAAQLGMGARPAFRFLEWPAMRASLPGIAGLVFMLCVTSFTIVLMLGGGPRATTLEVAIYQALRFDFDPARAVALTVMQIVLALVIFIAITRLGGNYTAMANLSVTRRRYAMDGKGEKSFDLLVIAVATLFVAGPMAAVVIAGLGADLGRLAADEAVRCACFTSLALAAPAAFLSAGLSLALVACRRALEYGRRQRRASWLEWASGSGASLILVLPPTVIGAGWFIILLRLGDVYAAAPAMVIAVNALMAIPFAVRVVQPAYDAASARNERLCGALGIAGWNRLRLIDGPVLSRPLGTAFAFAMALSLGDLGVIALFGSDRVQTLPYLLMQRMGSYRTEDAAGIALLLGALCLGLMMISDRLGRNAA